MKVGAKMKYNFAQFYKRSVSERKKLLESYELYDATLDQPMTDEALDLLIENYITSYEIPLGIAPDFLINGTYYNVPMATEEPSVIAGAAHAAKIIERHGGFEVTIHNRLMIGQIIFKHVKEPKVLIDFVELHKTEIFEVAKHAHPHIHSLGGGLKSFNIEEKEHQFVTFYAHIDTLDAMGANTVNTILEAISNFLENQLGVSTLMSILSNLATESLVTAKVILNPINLKHSDTIAQDIALANLYATIDPYRATTHNKGIMNGVTAVVLASGNDTRAIEAACHSYAVKDGQYKPLTNWYVNQNGMLVGEITLPLALGTLGGSMNTNPKVKLVHKLLGITTAKELMMVVASVGLAQNFAALYALTTDGIQKGHMRLHARHIAKEAGATMAEMDEVINHLITSKNITIDEAKHYLKTKKAR